MRTRPSRGPDFVHSADLLQAAMNIVGHVDGTSLAKAMRSSKMRRALREEQLRLATQKVRALTGGEA